MKITESKIEAKVVAYCKKRGLLTYKFSSPSQRGVPDRVIIGKFKVLFLELKAPGKEPTPLQYHHLNSISAHGTRAFWADGFEEAKGLIDTHFGAPQFEI